MRLLLSMMLALACSGQQTVVQKLFTDVAVATTSAAVTNAGQVGHQVHLQLSNAPALSCTVPYVNAQLEYSMDGSTWATIGAPQSSWSADPSRLTYIYYAGGIFNYVRFALTSFDTTNCRATAWYTGSASQVMLSQVQGPNPPGQFVKVSGQFNANPVLVAGVGSGKVQQITACDVSSGVTVTAGSNGSINVPSANVCAVTITMSAAGNVGLFAGDTIACATGSYLTPIFTLASGVPLSLGSGLGRLFSIPAGKFLCASATGGNAAILVSYSGE